MVNTLSMVCIVCQGRIFSGQYNSIYYVVYGAYCSGIDAATASIPLATIDNMMIAVYFKGVTEA